MAEATALPKFKRVQRAFSAHLRDPEHNPAPADVEDRRMKIYRDLFYNNVDGFIANGFPVLRKLHDDVTWHRLVRDYFSRHQSHTPFFHGIAEEFLHYLQDERGTQPEDPPFLLELAHYEWVELALGISEEEIDWAGVQADGDLVTGVPVLSPLAWNLAYQYPVHRISPDFRPAEPGAQSTHIVVYRDRNDRVGFMEVNAVTARLLQLIEAQPGRTGREQLQTVAQELGYSQPEVVIEGGREMLESLRRRDIVLGTRIS
jgi:uncharacterized protein